MDLLGGMAAFKKHVGVWILEDQVAERSARFISEWITAAKGADTRQRRLAQAITWMSQGKPRNWKYLPKKKSARKSTKQTARKRAARKK